MSNLRQRGGVIVVVAALLIFAMLAAVVLTGTRLVLTEHRISANSARTDAAFAAAEAGIQNALAYLNANRSIVASSSSGGWLNGSSTPHWTACASSQTALPCGNGTSNLYGSTWFYYGLLPNQQALGSGYTVSTWALSNTINSTPQNIPYFGCTNLALTALVPSVTVTLINTVNTLLNLIQPGMGLPANLCLPINFSQMPPAPWASSINPSITVVASASSGSDPAGGAAIVQQTLSATSLFAGTPPATFMVNGTVSLAGDIRIWGNMRPPTKSPMDFSVLNLNNVAGLNVTSLLNTTLGGIVNTVTSLINVSFAPVLNVTTSQVLGFNWNVTFPLSIWSSSTTTLSSGPVGLSILSGARTCDPQFNGTPTSPCTPLSEAVSIPAGSILLLVPPLAVNLPLKLPDVQDPQNLVSVVTGLIGSSVPAFPSDLFNFVFGYASAQSLYIQRISTQQSDCVGVGTAALYWVSGNCALSGTIGSSTTPVTIVGNGNVTLAAGTDFWGVLYLRGSGAKTLTGPASGTRPTVHGAIVSEGALTGSGLFNVAYDINAIRAAGFRAGGFGPVPGGWHDAAMGP